MIRNNHVRTSNMIRTINVIKSIRFRLPGMIPGAIYLCTTSNSTSTGMSKPGPIHFLPYAMTCFPTRLTVNTGPANNRQRARNSDGGIDDACDGHNVPAGAGNAVLELPSTRVLPI